MAFKYRNDYKFNDPKEDLNKVQRIDNLEDWHEELANKTLELQELQAELLAVKQLVEVKDQILSKTKEDLRVSQVNNNKAVGEHRFLQEEILILQKEQEKTLEDYEKILDKIEGITADRNEKMRIIEILEEKNRALERELIENKERIGQLEYALSEVKNKENSAQYELKIVNNEMSLIREHEEELSQENYELKIVNEKMMEKLQGLNCEISDIQEKNKEKDKVIEGFSTELRDYDEVLKGFKENKREQEEKERGILKIKELIVRNEEKDRIIEKRDREVIECKVVIDEKERCVEEIKRVLALERESLDMKDRKIKELMDRIEMMEFKQREVKDYLGRKGERMKARREAELALMQSLRVQI